jgi:hypothetical protein
MSNKADYALQNRSGTEIPGGIMGEITIHQQPQTTVYIRNAFKMDAK